MQDLHMDVEERVKRKKKRTRRRKKGIKKHIRNRVLIAVGILGILTAAAVIAFCVRQSAVTVKKKETVVCMDKERVGKEEYAILIRANANVVQMNYETDQANAEDFWETETDGSAPWEELQKRVEEKLKYHYALKQLADQLHVTKDYTYKTLMADRERENDERSEKTEQEEVVYGLQEFDKDQYYTYWYSNLETQVQNALIQSKVKVSEKDCKAYYDEHKDEYAADERIHVIYAEAAGEDGWQTARNIQNALEHGYSVEELQGYFPEIEFNDQEFSSLDMEQGLSGIQDSRWQIAASLEDGKVSSPFEYDGKYAVIKRIERLEDQPAGYDLVKDKIERTLQVQKAADIIAEKVEKMKVAEGAVSAKDVILKTVKGK